MRIAVLTRSDRGLASRFLVRLRPPWIDVAAILLDEGAPDDDLRGRLARRTRKLRRVGLSAIPVGLALRRAYADAGAGGVLPLEELRVPIYRVPTLNGSPARQLLGALDVDVAVSLGSRLLRPDTFELPRLGTINVHHGAVPDFRGGPPVFWELALGRSTVGFVVHRVDTGIDTGPLLAAGEVEIRLRPTLTETLTATLPVLFEASLDALDEVLAALEAGAALERLQDGSAKRPARTTPRLADYVRVRRSLRRRGSRLQTADDD